MPEQRPQIDYRVKHLTSDGQHLISTTRAQKIIGVMATSFGVLFFALPYWFFYRIGNDCTDREGCAPSGISHALGTFGIIAISGLLGFTPLFITHIRSKLK